MSLAPGLWSRGRWTAVEDSLVYIAFWDSQGYRDHVSKIKKKKEENKSSTGWWHMPFLITAPEAEAGRPCSKASLAYRVSYKLTGL